MKKKITLTALALSLITSICLRAAQAPTQPFIYEYQDIFYQITSEGLKISLTPESAPTEILNIMATPIGEDDEDMTVKTLMKAADRSSRAFCFILCITANSAGAPAIVVADDNLHPLSKFPKGMTPLRKYKLYTGGKGQCFPPDFIIQPSPPTILVQHVPVDRPYPVPAPYPVAVPVRELYPAPFPVFVNRMVEIVRTQVVTIPYKELATHEPAPLLSLPVQPSLPLQAPQFNEEGTQKLQELLASMQQKSQVVTVTTPSTSAPTAHPTRPSSPNPHDTASSQGPENIRVDRILHPQDADSASLLPIILTPPQTPAPEAPKAIAPTKKHKNRKKKQSTSESLAAVSEADEDDIFEQEKSSAALQAQERILQEKRDAELRVAAAQEVAEHEQEKIRALEAARKAQEDKRLKKIEETAALQTMKDKQEQTRKDLEKQQKDQRSQQAQKDRETAALKKAKEETAKQQEFAQQAAAKKVTKEKTKTMAAAAVTSSTASSSGKKKGKATAAAANDDDDFEKLMEQAAAFNAKLPQKQEKKLADTASARSTLDALAPQLTALFLEDDGEELLFRPISQTEKEADMIEKISNGMEEGLYVMAKELLKRITPNTTQYYVFLTDIYLNASRLLNPEEVANLMTNALKLAKDKHVDRWNRCVLYFGLAIHAQDQDLKEDFLDKCINLDTDKIHLRALALKKKMVLARYDSANPLCKTRSGECLHKETFLYVRALEASDNCFGETILLKIKFLVKAISAPDSCWQLTSIMKGLKIDPRETLIEYYDTKVRQSDHTAEELAEINSLIPADIIPTDELHRLE